MSETEKGRAAPVGATSKGVVSAAKSHTVTVFERADVQITGVVEVVSFDESSVFLKTAAGDLVLEGTGLRVHVLDVEGGRLAVSGELLGLYYSTRQENERRARRGLFGK